MGPFFRGILLFLLGLLALGVGIAWIAGATPWSVLSLVSLGLVIITILWFAVSILLRLPLLELPVAIRSAVVALLALLALLAVGSFLDSPHHLHPLNFHPFDHFFFTLGYPLAALFHEIEYSIVRWPALWGAIFVVFFYGILKRLLSRGRRHVG